MSAGLGITDAALAGFEQALNHYISLDPEGAQRLLPMQGRVICIELAGFGSRVYLVPGRQGIQVYGDYAAEPDCILRGSPVALSPTESR